MLVLKGAFKNTSSGLLLRKSLIIAQFVTSVVLIAGTVIVLQQVNYMRNQSLGANINQTLVVKGPQTIADSLYQNTYQPFKSAVLQQKGIKNIAASSSVMGDEIYWTNGSKRLGVEQARRLHFITLALTTILFRLMVLPWLPEEIFQSNTALIKKQRY